MGFCTRVLASGAITNNSFHHELTRKSYNLWSEQTVFRKLPYRMEKYGFYNDNQTDQRNLEGLHLNTLTIKHYTFTYCWIHDGPLSTTLCQH